MWWQWLIFIIIIIVTPFAVAYVGVCVKRKNKLTKEQEKAIEVNVIKFVLFYWLADLFYMSLIIDSIPCKYIFGGFILLIVFYNLTMSFLSSTKKDALQRVGLLQDFVVGMGLTIYLIYIIPGKQVDINGVVTVDNSLRDIITTIVAAVYGGLFTLIGVAWTIRKGDADRNKELARIEKERKEEDRKKHVPYLKIVIGMRPSCFVKCNIEQLLDFDDEKSIAQIDEGTFYGITIRDFIVKNVSSDNILLQGILLDDKFYNFDIKQLLEVNTACDIQTTDSQVFLSAKPLKRLLICVEDVIGNRYMLEGELCLHLEGLPIKVTTKKGIEYQGFRYRYIIDNLALPILVEEYK